MRSTKSPSWTERLLGLEPQPLPTTVFGVDARGVRAVWNSPGDSNGLLSAEVSFNEPVFQEGPLGGPVAAPEELRRALDLLLQQVPDVRRASLVVPDEWLRLVFADADGMPRGGAKERDEILRWKLQQLIPFRVDDLRLHAQRQPDPKGEGERVLIGFGIEVLFAVLESEFEHRGIWIGNLVSESLALLQASGQDDGVGLLLVVRESGYTLVMHDSGAPLLVRLRAEDPDASAHLPLEPLLREVALSQRNFSDREVHSSQVLRLGALDEADAGRLQEVLPGRIQFLETTEWGFGLTAGQPPADERFVPLAAAARGVVS